MVARIGEILPSDHANDTTPARVGEHDAPVLSFHADLRSIVAEVQTDEVIVAMRMGQIAPATQAQPSLSDDVIAGLNRNVFVVLSPTGTASALLIPESLPAAALAIWRELASSLQFTAPGRPRDLWSATELDTSGEVLVEYRALVGGVRFRKRKLYYKRIATPEGLVTPRDVLVTPESSEMVYGLDDRGLVRSLSGMNVTTVDVSSFSRRFRFVTEVTFELAGSQSTSTWPALDRTYHRTSVYADPASLLQGRDVDQVDSPTRNLSDLLAESRGRSAGDRVTEGRLIGELERLFRNSPNAIREALSAMDAASGPLILRTLGRLGSSEAQAALVTVLSDRARGTMLREAAATNLIDIQKPTESTVSALRALVHAETDGVVRQAASYALGATAAKLQNDAPRLAAEIVDSLVADLKSASDPEERLRLVDSLGNTHHPNALASLELALKSEDRRLRYSATLALRSMPGDQAELLLGQILGNERDSSVRMVALGALETRSPERLLSIVETTVRNERDPTVRAAAVDVLAAWARSGVEQARTTLHWSATNDKASSIRDRAAAALANGS